MVAVQHKESIVGSGSYPANLQLMTRSSNIEQHTIGGTGQIKSLAGKINDDRAGVTTSLQWSKSASVAHDLFTASTAT